MEVIYRDFNFKLSWAHSDAWTWTGHFKKKHVQKKNTYYKVEIYLFLTNVPPDLTV